MATILLTTINARYAHSALGLRYLRANLGGLAASAEIMEFSLGVRPEAMVERLLAREPRIVGFGVYVWNAVATRQAVSILRAIRPDVIVVVGGPEVSHEIDEQALTRLADYVVAGPGEAPFRQLCSGLVDWFAGRGPRPGERVLRGSAPAVDGVALPYDEYDAQDIAHRNIYVEASRGCPFRCEFCLSALDPTAIAFDRRAFLEALAQLHSRGARRFKFVDRTFNLRLDDCERILEFLLECNSRTPQDPTFAHFELIPDRLPERLRDRLVEFAPGTLQLEIGIQTWNPEVQRRVSRRQDNAAAEDNLRWLRTHTRAHLHVDLIAGLPGETLASFADGFDRLAGLAPQEIQIGILKRLRGAPIVRHAQAFDMRFSPDPPYALLASSTMSFAEMREVERIARVWDLVGNSGRYPSLGELLPGGGRFAQLRAFAAWLHERTDASERIAAQRVRDLLGSWLVEDRGCDAQQVRRWTGLRAATHRRPAGAAASGAAPPVHGPSAPMRQRRHLA